MLGLPCAEYAFSFHSCSLGTQLSVSEHCIPFIFCLFHGVLIFLFCILCLMGIELSSSFCLKMRSRKLVSRAIQ